MIRITEAAKTKMVDTLIDEGAKYLRFGLQGGGCNGFTYYFAIERELTDDDVEVSLEDGYVLLIDPMSMMYLEESEVDYKKGLMEESFVFNNPNATHSCGCGSSVSF